MATPRKHWFRVQDSILHETWPIEVKGVMVNLCAYLNTRWAREGLSTEDACGARLSPAACMLVTGSQRLVKARSLLRRLAVETQLIVTEDGDDTLIRWDKFAEAQALTSLKLPESRPRVAPSASAPAPSPASAPAEKKREESKPAVAGHYRDLSPAAPVEPETEPPTSGKRRGRVPSPRVPAPDVLTADEQQRLDAWCREAEPEMLGELPRIAAKVLDWGRGKGVIRPDWIATIRNAVRSDADKRRAAAKATGTRGLREMPQERGPRAGMQAISGGRT